MLAWSLQDTEKKIHMVLFLISPIIGASTISLGFFFFFLFQCYELTVWILEVVILIEQSSNRELSARPDSVESEIVPKLEKYPTERGDGGSGDGGGKITDLCLVTVSFISDTYSH